MTDGERPDLGAPLEAHRAMVSGALVRSLVVGALVLSVGPLAVVTGVVVGRTVPAIQLPLWILAGLCTLAGPIHALVGVSRSMRDDALLSVREHGVVYERAQASLSIGWDELARVRFESPDAIVFERTDGEALLVRERFDDVRGLAERLEELRRKASFGLKA